MDPRDMSDEELSQMRDLAIRVARGKGANEPEDIAQEVMIKLTRLRSVPKNPEAWMNVVAKNLVIDDGRRRDRRPGEIAEDGGAHRDLYEWLVRGVPASAAGMQSMAYEWFHERLSTVFSDKEIELMSLVSVGTPQNEIAALMGYKDASVVKSTISRVRKKADGLDRGELRGLLEHPRMYGGGRHS